MSMGSAPSYGKHSEAVISRIAPWRVLLPPAALALLLGLWGLDRGGSMWRDESVTWQVAHRPLGELWELLGRVDAVHGLYYLLMHGVFAVSDGAGAHAAAGAAGGLWALRLPSVAATALAAAGVAAIGHRLAGARGGRAGEGAGGRAGEGAGGRAGEGAGGRAGEEAGGRADERAGGRADERAGGRADGRAGEWAGGRAGGQAGEWAGGRAGGRAGEWAGLWAGLLYAVLPPVQMYAQEGRSYALVAAAVVWATYLLLRERWVPYTALLVLACWLHEFAVLALLAHAVTGWRSRAWRRSAAVVVVLLLPLAVLSAGQAGQQLAWLGRPSAADWAAYAVVATASLLLARGADRELVRVALPLALLPAGLLMTVSLVHPWYVDRYVLYSLAGLALLAGAARPRVLLPLTAVLVAAAVPWSLWLRTPESRKDDALAVAGAVRAVARPGDAVLFMPARRREWLLSSPEVYEGLRDVALAGSPAASDSLQGTELPSAEILARLVDSPRVVAVQDPADQPRDPYPREAVKRQTLVGHFELCSVTEVRGARVALYARPGECGR
ncbi:hypothetical protein [Streptomyces sp. NPDC051211]|uniref:hypothetical protein n=1 Tax=Streptomyces sp. NPDC051211 TaxID=3154643 RepID=UPI003450211D